MDDLDFSKSATPAPRPVPAAKPAPELPSVYDAKLALKFFQSAGQEESFAAGKTIFAEQEKAGRLFSRGARIYLLLDGEVALTLQGKPVHLVLPGETFGELAVILDAPRSATATARKACRVLWLDEKRFLASLQQEPGFALMLLGMLAQNLRNTANRVLARSAGNLPPRLGGRGLDDTMLAALRRMLGDPTPTAMKAGQTIVSEGAVGAFMFIVVTGEISIAIGDKVIEQIGAGETFGEIALLGPTARAASATALSDGTWLPVARADFLKMVAAQPAAGIVLLRSMSERIQHLSALLGT